MQFWGMDIYNYFDKLRIETPLTDDTIFEKFIFSFLSQFAELTEFVQTFNNDGYYHCDIKLDNILIDPVTLQIKLVDFGFFNHIENMVILGQNNQLLNSPTDLEYINCAIYQPLEQLFFNNSVYELIKDESSRNDIINYDSNYKKNSFIDESALIIYKVSLVSHLTQKLNINENLYQSFINSIGEDNSNTKLNTLFKEITQNYTNEDYDKIGLNYINKMNFKDSLDNYIRKNIVKRDLYGLAYCLLDFISNFYYLYSYGKDEIPLMHHTNNNLIKMVLEMSSLFYDITYYNNDIISMDAFLEFINNFKLYKLSDTYDNKILNKSETGEPISGGEVSVAPTTIPTIGPTMVDYKIVPELQQLPVEQSQIMELPKRTLRTRPSEQNYYITNDRDNINKLKEANMINYAEGIKNGEFNPIPIEYDKKKINEQLSQKLEELKPAPTE